MRSFLLTSFVTIILSIVLLLIIDNLPIDKEVIKAEIEANLIALVEVQATDLKHFENQFRIYSNPFDISSSERFKKRVFVDGRLVYWSDNFLIGEYTEFVDGDDLSVLNSRGNIFLVRKNTVNQQKPKIEIFSFLPLRINPPIKNEFFHEFHNEAVFEDYQVSLGSGLENVSIDGLNIPITIKNYSIHRFDYTILVLILMLALVFVGLVYQSKYKLSQKWLIVFLGLLSIRGLLWGLTQFWVENPLFDPIHYTSRYGASLGDLLLNILTAYILLQFCFIYFKSKLRSVNRWVQAISAVLFIHFIGFILFKLSWNIQNNSLITLDITDDIQFDSHRILSYVILIFISAIFFQVFGVAKSIIAKLILWRWQVTILYILVSIVFILLAGKQTMPFFIALSVIFFLTYFFNLGFNSSNLDYRSFIYTSLLIGFIAMGFTYSISQYFEKDELVSKERFANRLLIKNDFLGEYYLDKRMSEFQDDPYIRSRVGNPLLANRNIKDRIRRQYLSSYFDKYDIDIRLFDMEGNPVDQLLGNYDSLKSLYAHEAYATDYDQIYFVRDEEGNLQDRYFCFVPIISFNEEVGYIVLSLTLKKYIPKSVFPQLMVESRYYFSDENRFDYAFYKKGKLLYKRGRLEFLNFLDYPKLINPKIYSSGLEVAGYHFFALNTSDETTIVIASPSYRFGNLISNFSFFFLLILFSFAVLLSASKAVNKDVAFNLSSKIQIYLAVSLIIPMLIVSIALLNTLNESYKEEIDKSFTKKAYNISSSLIDICEQYLKNQINRDDINHQVSEIASLIQSDINLYSSDGKLIVSSEREIFKNGLLSNNIDPAAYNAIKYGNTESKVLKQSIGDLDFRVAYISLRSNLDGHLIGILSLPYFDSKNHLKRQQVEVFNNLISIFTVIFIISLILGNLAIDRLVRPLRIIAERLKTTDLKEVNQQIEYSSADEIGILINEYNLMITKLEESKEALAESQKESAWKEIARQVAHEIKNPLTPMRLKIQQMMRTTDKSSKEYITLNSLIDQIDRLSSIADSFSAFAKMPAPKNEIFDVSALITSVADVHSREGVPVETELTGKEILINTDPKIFSGILNNIILNAQQSVVDQQPKVKIRIDLKPRKVIIQIQDNGNGITEENREKIFTPYFSTKLTGSGIGLAVAKKGIENAGGNIWFETKVGKGTTFFISLPIAAQ